MARGKSLLALAWSHLKVGYVSFLLVVDAAVIAILATDIGRFRGLGLRIDDGVRLALQDLHVVVLVSVAYFLGLTVLLPALLCLFRIYAGTGPKLSGWFGRRHWSITGTHLVASLILGIEEGLADGFRRLSGLAIRTGGLAYLYEPRLPTPLAWVALAALILAPFVGPMVRWVSEWDRAPQWMRDYWILVPLADLNGRLYPTQGRYGVNFDGGLAPEIRLAREAARRARKGFQRGLAASRNAWVQLNKRRLAETQGFFAFLLKDVESSDEMVWSVFSGTSRALDAALSRVPGRKQIVMSHLEHPTEEKVANWHARLTDSPDPIHLAREGVWSTPWSESEEWLGEQIERLAGESQVPVVLLISEVSYATGLVIPLRRLLERLEPLRRSGKLHVIVDGAHSAGNMGVIRTRAGWDSYIASTHKWLYSPEPGGLLFWREGAGAGEAIPYDAWTRHGPPASTTAVETIAALFGSAELLHPQRAERLWQRCAELRDLFLEVSKEQFIVVGDELRLQNTGLLSISPAAEFAWDNPDALEERFFRAKVRLTVVRIDERPALRLAFHYFQDGVQVLRLAKTLRRALRYTGSSLTGPQ